jgi:hypothetical protein
MLSILSATAFFVGRRLVAPFAIVFILMKLDHLAFAS